MTKVKLTIEYTTPMLQKVSSFMSGCDLDIDEVVPEPMIINYTTKTKVDKKYKDDLIKKFKEEYKDFIIKDIKFEIIKEI